MKMLKIKYCRCDGGKKGEECKNIVQNSCEKFFNIGIENIEKCCNLKRENLINKLKEKKSDDKMSDYNIQATYMEGIKELSLPFRLSEPVKINIYIIEGVRPENLISMGVQPIEKDFKKWNFFIFLDNLDYSNSALKWKGFQESVEDITYHELIHICGDSPFTGRHDGILRHNKIGILCVKDLLNEV